MHKHFYFKQNKITSRWLAAVLVSGTPSGRVQEWVEFTKQMDWAVAARLAAGAPVPGSSSVLSPQQVQQGLRVEKGLWGGRLRDLNCSEIHRHFWGDKLWSWHWAFLWRFLCVCVERSGTGWAVFPFLDVAASHSQCVLQGLCLLFSFGSS